VNNLLRKFIAQKKNQFLTTEITENTKRKAKKFLIRKPGIQENQNGYFLISSFPDASFFMASWLPDSSAKFC